LLFINALFKHYRPLPSQFLLRSCTDERTFATGAANPDIIQENIAAALCSKTSSVEGNRPSSAFTKALKKKQMAEWGLPGTLPNYEEDHLEGLEDGGCGHCETNLWPQPYGDANHLMTITQRRAWDRAHPGSTAVLAGALQKDDVESYIHDEICFDVPNHKVTSKKALPATVSISLERGQEILSTDWYACYLKTLAHQPCQ
jgi:hypothetical protein